MDVYMEELVKKRKEKPDYIKTALLIFGGLIATVVIVIGMLILSVLFQNMIIQLFSSLFPVFLLGLWYLIYRLNNKLSVEYEYTLINSSFDIDKIMSKKSRKRVASIDIKDASLIACIDDNENNYAYKNPKNGVNIINCSGMDEMRDTYFIECMISGQKSLVLIQPTSKMIEAFFRFNPKTVKIYNS